MWFSQPYGRHSVHLDMQKGSRQPAAIQYNHQNEEEKNI